MYWYHMRICLSGTSLSTIITRMSSNSVRLLCLLCKEVWVKNRRGALLWFCSNSHNSSNKSVVRLGNRMWRVLRHLNSLKWIIFSKVIKIHRQRRKITQDKDLKSPWIGKRMHRVNLEVLQPIKLFHSLLWTNYSRSRNLRCVGQTTINCRQRQSLKTSVRRCSKLRKLLTKVFLTPKL